ncbi:NYN domain-containing protein [Pseudomonas atacamensis]|uniref:NYN domain-containing protein n=1 Tax=Pseudomonas atacamensis TaxID=2565368 RepID=UPI001F2BDDD7|nr:NYN domain-containing protein [Pseudomonas atacamensis]
MNTIVYVDGFNLYYRALKGSPHKWLNLQALCEASLPKHCKIVGINFYTARISSRVDPSSPRDQHIYLKALQTIPGLQQHFGSFRVTDLFMYLDQPVVFRPAVEKLPDPAPRYARVVKSEEKGSDVNLGVHLVRDAFQGKFEHAAVITNDTDLVEPLRIVTEDAKLPVTLLTPTDQTAKSLRNVATYVRRIRNYLGVSQFPNPVVTPDGIVLAKPENW